MMKNNNKLFEGLQEHDLDDLVLPLISIDEYESKIDDDALVVAFYVQDQEPANDLNHFIQKGSVTFLDTDVSPAPDENGYFLVFVEFVRQPRTAKDIVNLVDSMENLTNISDWSFKPYNHSKVLPLTLENVQKTINLKNPDFDGNLKEFLMPSELDDLVIEGDTLLLSRNNQTLKLRVIDFGTLDRIMEKHGLHVQSINFDNASIRNCRLVEGYVGFGWNVNQLREHVMLVNPDESHALLAVLELCND